MDRQYGHCLGRPLFFMKHHLKSRQEAFLFKSLRPLENNDTFSGATFIYQASLKSRMTKTTLLAWTSIPGFAEPVWIDLALAFTFFTAVTFATLVRRFEHRRSAIAISVALGAALATALIRWMVHHGWSLQHIGPLAAAIVVLVIAIVLTQLLKVNEKSTGLIFVMVIIGVVAMFANRWEVSSRGLLAPAVITLILAAFMFSKPKHRKGITPPAINSRSIIKQRSSKSKPRVLERATPNVRDLEQGRRQSQALQRGLRRSRRQADRLNEHPKDAQNVLLQLRRMLPTEGRLTNRLAQLREQHHYARKGHIARIKQLRQAINNLNPSQKKQVADEIRRQYTEAKLATRLERLDKTAADVEARIRQLTGAAEQAAARYDQRRLHSLLKEAESLQKHTTKLFALIEQSQKQLDALALRAAAQASQRGSDQNNTD